MTQELEWQINYSKACSLFDREKEKFFQKDDFKEPQKLFEWAKVMATKTIEVSSACSGNHVAFDICSEIHVSDNDHPFSEIITYGKSLGLNSEVQASDIKYQAVVVISMFLDREGLGSRL